MTGEDDGPTFRVELRPHAQALLEGLSAKQPGVDRRHESTQAIETLGLGAGRQPFEVTIRARDVAVGACSNMDDDVSAFRHKYSSITVKIEPVSVQVVNGELPQTPGLFFKWLDDLRP